ncbi:MAG: XRE family transcriptional regulator [Sphingobacteriaceae bacterium]|nr:MAG: XRE family transcriptional regulator [Sphingobacteriaceae bacterium]
MTKTGLKIRILRHSAGLDQHQAAEKMEISVAEYSRIETGLTVADDGLFDRLVVLFGLSKT